LCYLIYVVRLPKFEILFYKSISKQQEYIRLYVIMDHQFNLNHRKCLYNFSKQILCNERVATFLSHSLTHVSLSLSFKFKVLHTNTHTLFLSLSLSDFQSNFKFYTHRHTLFLSLPPSPSPPLSLSLSLTHTHFTYSIPNTHIHTLSFDFLCSILVS